MSKIYIVETRKTAGAFQSQAVCNLLDDANAWFDDFVNHEFPDDEPVKTELTKSEQRKYPDVVRYSKYGGSHCNVIIRIRETELS